MQQQIGTQLQSMGTPGQFAQGTGAANLGIGANALGLGSLAGFNDPNAVQSFMSPYQQNVIDVNKSEALRDAQKGLTAGNLGAVRQGTYGGARQLLAQTEQERK